MFDTFCSGGTVIMEFKVVRNHFFFLNKTCDPSGHGEGAFYLGQLGMTTDPTGVVHFSTTKSSLPFSSGYLTSTATDRDGNTSEFSACLKLTRMVFIPLVMR